MASDVFHQLYYHFVWTTKNRRPLIADASRGRVIQEIEIQCRIRGGAPIACNLMPDHIHLAVNLPPSISISTFIGKVKGASSHNLAEETLWEVPFGWQDGYGVITFRRGELDKIVKYIQNQDEIHATRKTSKLLESISQRDPPRRADQTGL